MSNNLLSYLFSRIHICCTKLHARPGVADRLLRDLQEAVNSVMENPGDKCTGAVSRHVWAKAEIGLPSPYGGIDYSCQNLQSIDVRL